MCFGLDAIIISPTADQCPIYSSSFSFSFLFSLFALRHPSANHSLGFSLSLLLFSISLSHSSFSHLYLILVVVYLYFLNYTVLINDWLLQICLFPYLLTTSGDCSLHWCCVSGYPNHWQSVSLVSGVQWDFQVYRVHTHKQKTFKTVCWYKSYPSLCTLSTVPSSLSNLAHWLFFLLMIFFLHLFSAFPSITNFCTNRFQ